MRLKDISLVSQGIEDSQNELKRGIDSATSVFENSNTLAGQAVQESQAGLKSQINQATAPFENNNMLIDKGINQVKSGLSQQINQATEPFENKNSLFSMAMKDDFNMKSLFENDDDGSFSLAKLAMLSRGTNDKPRYKRSISRYEEGDFQYGY